MSMDLFVLPVAVAGMALFMVLHHFVKEQRKNRLRYTQVMTDLRTSAWPTPSTENTAPLTSRRLYGSAIDLKRVALEVAALRSAANKVFKKRLEREKMLAQERVLVNEYFFLARQQHPEITKAEVLRDIDLTIMGIEIDRPSYLEKKAQAGQPRKESTD